MRRRRRGWGMRFRRFCSVLCRRICRLDSSLFRSRRLRRPRLFRPPLGRVVTLSGPRRIRRLELPGLPIADSTMGAVLGFDHETAAWRVVPEAPWLRSVSYLIRIYSGADSECRFLRYYFFCLFVAVEVAVAWSAQFGNILPTLNRLSDDPSQLEVLLQLPVYPNA